MNNMPAFDGREWATLGERGMTEEYDEYGTLIAIEVDGIRSQRQQLIEYNFGICDEDTLTIRPMMEFIDDLIEALPRTAMAEPHRWRLILPTATTL